MKPARSVRELLLLGAEVLRVVAALGIVERGRGREGPAPLVSRLRRRGREAPARDAAARARLRTAIRWVDARLPGGSSCYRRVLLETALDRAAAAEALVLGLDAGFAPGSGHAWLRPRDAGRGGSDDGRAYDAEVAL